MPQLPDAGSPSIVVAPAEDRPGFLARIEHPIAPVCRPLPPFPGSAPFRLGVFLGGRLVTHTTLDPMVWRDMVDAGWLEHPLRLMLHVDRGGGPHVLTAQWYLVGGIRAPAREYDGRVESPGWLPRMLTFPQIHSRFNSPVADGKEMERAVARLAFTLAFGASGDLSLGDSGA